MSARALASSLAHTHVNTLTELLHQQDAARALARFSSYLNKHPLDAMSTNALHFVAQPVQHGQPAGMLIARAQQTKRQIDVCSRHLAEVIAPRLRNRTVVAHPLRALSAGVLTQAKGVTFLYVNLHAARTLPSHKLKAFRLVEAHRAMDTADLVLIEPRAVTRDGAIVQEGGRVLAELARARGLPVYAVATSWHVLPAAHPRHGEELLPAQFLTSILSEHGAYAHDQFLSRVQKAFPLLLE